MYIRYYVFTASFPGHVLCQQFFVLQLLIKKNCKYIYLLPHRVGISIIYVYAQFSAMVLIRVETSLRSLIVQC